jgi:hypothetical protein
LEPRVERRLAGGGPDERVAQRLGAAVARDIARGSALDRVEDARRVGVGGQQDDARRELRHAVRLDQRVVDQRDVGVLFLDRCEEAVGVADLANELHVRAPFERPRQRVAKQRLAVRREDAHTASVQHVGWARHQLDGVVAGSLPAKKE